MKIILTETDETGLECKDTVIEIKDDEWYKKYIGTTEELNVPPKYDMTDWKSKYEEVREMLIRMIKEYERCYTINSMGLDIEKWWREWKNQKETK